MAATLLSPLPIDSHLPLVLATLREKRVAILCAEPGAGKTTRVPRALLDAGAAGGFAGETWVLEPRRVAAKLSAMRVAAELGEEVGRTVGYSVRFEERSSKNTKIWFLTEGMFTRRLQSNPRLDGVSVVVLDEFHERHVQGDVALYLTKRLLADQLNLHLLVMSATLEAGPLATYLNAPVIEAKGRTYPVTLGYDTSLEGRPLELQVVAGVRSALRETSGGVLVFLPGAREIRRSLEALASVRLEGIEAVALHGDMPLAEQQRALSPTAADASGAPRLRKVILSTNLAESSLTVPGVTAVVDSGLVRRVTSDPVSGLSRLRIEPISQASAIQRAGRAGRTSAGHCIRLYSARDFERRPAYDVPEILRVDFADVLLELCALNAIDMALLDPPKAAEIARAEELLRRIGAIDEQRVPTELGRAMARLPLPVRLAKFVLDASARGAGDDACTISAILSERDLRRPQMPFASAGRARGGHSFGRPERDSATDSSDLLALLDAYREAEHDGFARSTLDALALDGTVARSVRQTDEQLSRLLSRVHSAHTRIPEQPFALDLALLSAYPDRVARRRKPQGKDLAVAGIGNAELDPDSVVRDAPFVLAVQAESKEGSGIRVKLAHAIAEERILDLFPERIAEVDTAIWDDEKKRASTVSRWVYDGLVLAENEVTGSVTPQASALLAERAIAAGFHRFVDEKSFTSFISRVRFAHAAGLAVPALTDDELAALIREAAVGLKSFAELREVGLLGLLKSRVPHSSRLAERAPESLDLPNGRRIDIHYDGEQAPWVESFLQDFCGFRGTPEACGKPITLHLLAPNKQAVQITRDLPNFWKTHYAAIRKELSRQYPRHEWPEDPSVPVLPRKPRPPRR